MKLEQQILDAIGGGAFTRDLLHAKFPRVSQDAIDITVYGLRRRRFIEENNVGRLTAVAPYTAATEVIEEEPPEKRPAHRPEESAVMAAEKRTCSRCGETKPISEFYESQGRCKTCFNIVQKEGKLRRAAAAGLPPPKTRQTRKLLPPPRRQSEGKAVTASRGNGALLIPAGIEISGEAFRERGQLQAIEIRSRDFAHGGEADRTPQIVRMNRPQAERVYYWLGQELAKAK